MVKAPWPKPLHRCDAPPQLEPPPVMDDEDYDGLSCTFARACKAADRNHAQEQLRINKCTEGFHADIPLIASDGVASSAELQRAYERRIARRDQHYGIPLSVQQAAEWLRFQVKDPGRFEAWLSEHEKQERQAIIAYLKKKESRQ